MKISILTVGALALTGLVATPAGAEARTVESVSATNEAQPYRYDSRYDRRYDSRYDRRYNNQYRGQQHFAYRQVRQMQGRVQQMRQDIRYFARAGALDRGEYRSLDRRAENLQRRIGKMARRGLTNREYRRAVSGIRDLHQRITRNINDGRRGRYYDRSDYRNYGYGYNNDRYYRDDERWSNDRRWYEYDRRDRRGRDRDDDDWDD